jgi:hypothetical protein
VPKEQQHLKVPKDLMPKRRQLVSWWPRLEVQPVLPLLLQLVL